MSGGFVKLQTERGVATLTIDSPANRNAMSRGLLRELKADIEAVSRDPAVRIVVIAASGSVFCAGADLKEQAQPGDLSIPETLAPVLLALWQCPKPVVVRVNGAVRGGGAGLIAAADIAISVDSASFAFTEVRVGAAPAVVAVVVLPKIGQAQALPLMLSGETFGTAKALAIGLIHQAVPAEDLDSAVQATVENLLLGAPNAQQETKRIVRDLPSLTVPMGFEHTAAASGRIFAAPEAVEGFAAFAEKRQPSWVVGAAK